MYFNLVCGTVTTTKKLWRLDLYSFLSKNNFHDSPLFEGKKQKKYWKYMLWYYQIRFFCLFMSNWIKNESLFFLKIRSLVYFSLAFVLPLYTLTKNFSLDTGPLEIMPLFFSFKELDLSLFPLMKANVRSLCLGGFTTESKAILHNRIAKYVITQRKLLLCLLLLIFLTCQSEDLKNFRWLIMF